MTKTRTLAVAALAAATALGLAACGTTESPDDASATGGSGSGGGSITLTDGAGTELTLDGPATTVVGTEWNVVGDLVSLGVEPVGVADVEGYQAWSAAVPLEGEPTDIGTRGEPSLDTVASLAPDLIVATTDLPADAVAQLRDIAPVLQVESADASAQVDRMIGNLELIAQATGTEDEAEQVVQEFRDTVEDGAQQLEEAGMDGTPVAFADAFDDAGQVSVRPYVAGSLVGDVNTELGLVDPWDLEGDAAYGLASTDVEGLTALPDDTRLVYAANDVLGDPFADTLADNAVWQSLPFVQDDHVVRLTDGIWMFGGPASMTAYVEALVPALTK